MLVEVICGVASSPESNTYCNGDFATNRLWKWRINFLQQFVEAGGHQLHYDPHSAALDQVTVALYDVLNIITLQQHFKIHVNTFVFIRKAASCHLFHGHNRSRTNVLHLVHRTTGAGAQLFDVSKVPFVNCIILFQTKSKRVQI